MQGRFYSSQIRANEPIVFFLKIKIRFQLLKKKSRDKLKSDKKKIFQFSGQFQNFSYTGFDMFVLDSKQSPKEKHFDSYNM